MVTFKPFSGGTGRPETKFIRGAANAETIPSNTEGLHSNMRSKWRQVDLINSVDTNLMVVCGIAEHTVEDVYECHFWYNQLALILDGEMVIQDMDNGEVYKAHRGDLYYWTPGHRHRHGGVFRAFFIKTPVPTRWVSTPNGKQGFDILHLENELLYPASPPDEIRKGGSEQSGAPKRKRMKFVRGVMDIEPHKVTGTKGALSQVDVINAGDSDLNLVAGVAEYKSDSAMDCDHRWHQIALILDGEAINEDVDTGKVYVAHEGDLFYWPPGLHHKVHGSFRAYNMQTPIRRRWVPTADGPKMMDMLNLESEMLYPASQPDEVRKDLLT